MCKHDVMNSLLNTPKNRPVSVSPLAPNGYSYVPFIAMAKAAYGLCIHQLGGHVELPWLMRKHDVIHKPEVHNVSRRRQRS